MNEKLLPFIESSFLSPLLKIEGVTDITYNGVNIFYMHTKEGRKKSKIKAQTNEVLDFIRQIANYSEKQFSYATPILDISIGKYRINAVHPSIVRVGDDKACSFAIRIGSPKSRIEGDEKFMSKSCEDLLLKSLKDGESIVIAGPTGSGKTELQKYLLSKLEKNTRVIIIDNIQELENLRINDDLDLTSWQISSSNPSSSIEELIRNALRSNPDWLVIAESRGKEMNDVLNSALTGHPIITTLHAKSIFDIPKRIVRMVEMNNLSQKHEDILSDVCSVINTYVFVNRKILKNGNVFRYIQSIGKLQNNGEMKVIFNKEFSDETN